MASVTFPPVGRLIAGKYRIDRLIGKGGMGVVYAARHELLDQPVAIKLLLGDQVCDEAAAARFLNEARAAARIPSDHVVRVLDVGIDRERPYFVMELLDGVDLAHLLEERGGRLPEKEAVEYVLEAIEALAQAHALGIIHRDLKPSNLFLAKRPDGSKVVKVLDFGIAKAFGPAAHTQAAVTTQGLIGSPAYMAPEYVRSAKSIDTRADIWAIGVILYELISGEVPFTGDNPGEVLAAILEKNVPSLVTIVGSLVSPGLADVVMKCLARKPEERFQELAEVAEALVPFAARTSPSIARIRATVTTLRLRPPSADTSGPISVARAQSPDDETALAPASAAQQTNRSWTGAAEPAPPSRGSRTLAVLAGVASALVLTAGFLWMRPVAPSVAASAPNAAAPATPPSIPAANANAIPTATATATATPTATPTPTAPPRRPAARPFRPAPQPAPPRLTRDRR